MATTSYLDHRWSRRSGRGGDTRPGGLSYGVGQGFKIIAAGPKCLGVGIESHNFPPQRRGHSLRVVFTQVVTMRLCVGSQRPKNGGRIGVDVRQGGNSSAAA